MSVQLAKKTINNSYFTFNAFCFIPSSSKEAPALRSECAIFTHGYTASKSDCIPWAQRLSEMGIPVCIFDLPGHHLGSINEVKDFEDFKESAHECFIDAFNFLKETLGQDFDCDSVILGGHSLGALLSLKALDLDFFDDYKTMAIGVGLGISQHKDLHLFNSAFYKNTLNIRRQLVCEQLDSDNVFPWISEEKLELDIRQKRIHLITGADDVVVGEGGMDALAFNLNGLGNHVTTNEPKKLAHHEPSLASSHIVSFLRKELD